MEQADTGCNQDAISTWAFWVQAIDRPDARELVTGINGAVVALSKIQERGFPRDEMDLWLLEWPTSYGMAQYQGRDGLSGSPAAHTQSKC